MNNSSLLVPDDFENERMTSIAIDVETQWSNSSITENNIESPLKSILKKTTELSDEDKRGHLKAIKFTSIIILLIIFIPLIICDIYYGFSNVSCVKEKPTNLDLTLKLYLLLSGFVNLLLLFIAIITIISINELDDNNIAYIFTIGNSYLCCIFNLLWNIIGAILFWGFIYESSVCRIDTSTYIFISIIIKLLLAFMFIYNKNK